MREDNKKDIQSLINDHKTAIKDYGPKKAIKDDPFYLEKDRILTAKEIAISLESLTNYYQKLFPFLNKIKSHIPDITEQTHIAAIYLTLCNVFEFWSSFFILLKNGKGTECACLLRTIKEGNMQVDLLVTEALKGVNIELNKWFSGEILSHGIGREKLSKFIGESKSENGNEFKELSTKIYQMESQAAHNSYESILECVSPFTEDYDFDGYSNNFRASTWGKYAIGSMEATNISLKGVFEYLKDNESYKALSEILSNQNIKYR